MSKNKNFSVIITGEWPGAGQSTTAKILAQSLAFERIYAGALFRKFAFVWNQKQKNISWDQFTHQAQTNTLNLEQYHFNESNFNESILHQFQHQLKTQNTPELWDKIIDTFSLMALKKPGVVVEAKVGVLLDQTGLVSLTNIKHKLYKFLLTCPPEISAHRVIKRKIENGELAPLDQDSNYYAQLIRDTATEIIERHLRDWERYEIIYGIYRSDIYKPGIIKIDTSNKSEDQVVTDILQQLSPS